MVPHTAGSVLDLSQAGCFNCTIPTFSHRKLGASLLLAIDFPFICATTKPRGKAKTDCKQEGCLKLAMEKVGFVRFMAGKANMKVAPTNQKERSLTVHSPGLTWELAESLAARTKYRSALM
jgi:hypothetical protein